MKKTIIGILTILALISCSRNNSTATKNPHPFFETIENDPLTNKSYDRKYRVSSFYREAQGGDDEPIINRQLHLNNIRSINLHNVQTEKIDSFSVYFFVFRWGKVGGSIYEPIDCTITTYSTRIHIEIPDSFIFENHQYDMTGEGKIVTLSRKYYVKFSYFDEVSLNYHFSIEEDEEEGIYKTGFVEEMVGHDSIYVTN